MFLPRYKARVAVVAGLMGVACLHAGGIPTRVDAQTRLARPDPPSSEVSARHFRADLAIRFSRVSSIGPARHAPPVLTMRIEQVEQQGRLRTSLVVDQPPGALVELHGARSHVPNPFQVVRVEYDDGDDAPRFFDRAGRRTRPAVGADLAMFGATRAVRDLPSVAPGRWERRAGGAFVAAAIDRDARRLDLQRRFGRAVGRVRGLDRYVTTTPEGATQEVLASPDTALPVEVIIAAKDGADVRSTMDYEAVGARGHVRKFTRTDRGMGMAGRAITEVALSNVVVGAEVRR